MRDISAKQRRALEVINEFIEVNERPPTVREIGDIMGLRSTSTVQAYLCRLKDRGLITWEERKPRTLKLIKI
ncbi:transcriptional regulator [Fictibacillus sp. JL2B1089]|uniref:LexA family protein n=1 Tax=Fictibacillus sp. JL2B1089 TaxID=3399565 RepID=UPI003A87AB29